MRKVESNVMSFSVPLVSRSVAVFQSLLDLILVTQGNRMDMPAAVWVLTKLLLKPAYISVIVHTSHIGGVKQRTKFH